LPRPAWIIGDDAAPGGTRVLPGEGEETTIAVAEKQFDSWASVRP
jgi:hypothetical protein